jgi:hypothetical protein
MWGALGVCFMGTASELYASAVKVSIGIRETNTAGSIFGDGGTGGGIEWVNRDGQTLTADGTWQLFTFTPATDTLLAFAGTTANSMLEPGHEFATLEHIRILNDEGITLPLRVWIDDVTNTIASGPVVQDFEAATLGSEVMFQEPGFSGSTSANLLPGSTTAVSNSMAHSGSQSLETNFQFVDNTPTRWVRLTSFGTPNQPNPRVRIREATGGPASISFYAKATVIPEPCTAWLLGIAGAALMGARIRP